MKFGNLPKIELHCHLDGSVRPETIIDIAEEEGISIPYYDTENIRKEVTAPAECKSLDEYLKRFEIPILVMQSKGSLRRITLEMCPTSNIQTKAIDTFKNHPIYDFHKAGIRVSVNTDNRTVSDTNMTKECQVLLREFSINFEEYKQIYLNSVDAAFVNDEMKEWLKKYIYKGHLF